MWDEMPSPRALSPRRGGIVPSGIVAEAEEMVAGKFSLMDLWTIKAPCCCCLICAVLGFTSAILNISDSYLFSISSHQPLL